MIGNLFMQNVFTPCLEKQKGRVRAGESCASLMVQLRKLQWWDNSEEVHIITPQMTNNFSVSLEEYLEGLTWKNWALLWQIRLTRTSVYVASTQTVTGNSWIGQAAPLTALIRAAALLRKMHVNIFVIYSLAETQPLQQFSREFSDTSHFLSVVGAIDCTHTFLIG